MNKQDELFHYGILGMKWGVRNEKSQAAFKRRKVNSSKRRAKTSNMSDAELRSTINRLNMDLQYRNLTGDYKTKGKDAVGKILGEVGKNSVRAVATAATVAVGKKVVELWKAA